METEDESVVRKIKKTAKKLTVQLAEYLAVDFSLLQARDWFVERALKSTGAICPCCLRWGKVYPRSLDRRKLAVLRTVAANHEIDAAAVKKIHGRDVCSAELFQLLAWGVCSRRYIEGDAYYSVTQYGLDFLAGRIAIDKYRYFYNRGPIQVARPDLTQIYVHEVRETNLPEIMGPAQ